MGSFGPGSGTRRARAVCSRAGMRRGRVAAGRIIQVPKGEVEGVQGQDGVGGAITRRGRRHEVEWLHVGPVGRRRLGFQGPVGLVCCCRRRFDVLAS